MDTNVKMITSLLNETILAIQDAVPLPVVPDKVKMITQPVTQTEIGVLIGVTGDLKGRLYVEGSKEAFALLGEAMFGITLSGDMLQSFAGEFGNIIGGGMSTNVATHRGLNVDITPPTVMVGHMQMYGFDKALCVPVVIDGAARLRVMLMLAEEKRGGWSDGKNHDHR